MSFDIGQTVMINQGVHKGMVGEISCLPRDEWPFYDVTIPNTIAETCYSDCELTPMTDQPPEWRTNLNAVLVALLLALPVGCTFGPVDERPDEPVKPVPGGSLETLNFAASKAALLASAEVDEELAKRVTSGEITSANQLFAESEKSHKAARLKAYDAVDSAFEATFPGGKWDKEVAAKGLLEQAAGARRAAR